MEEEDNENYKVCKLVLVGESGVGKTCITSRFVSDHFSNDNVSTSSASYCSKTLKIDEFSDKYIKFNIWDTCGQEKFRSLSKVFYKGIKAAQNQTDCAVQSCICPSSTSKFTPTRKIFLPEFM